MSVSQIEKLVLESIASGKHWGRIRLLGGEPMLHPAIFEILEVLENYRREYSPATKIEISTNGFGVEVNDRLGRVPGYIQVNNSRKSNRYQEKFDAFNLAPCDKWYYVLTDFTNACKISSLCGMGLNRFGYYPCTVAGSIDRVFGFNIGIKKLPDQPQEFDEQKRTLCRYCGHFPSRSFIPPEYKISLRGEPRSKSWVKSYQRFAEKPPILSLY